MGWTTAFPPVRLGVLSINVPVNCFPSHTMKTMYWAQCVSSGEVVLAPGGYGNPEAHVVMSVRRPNLHSRSLAPFGSSGLVGMAAANSMTKMNVPSLELIDVLTMS